MKLALYKPAGIWKSDTAPDFQNISASLTPIFFIAGLLSGILWARHS
jgi:hypothetical protein